MKKVFLASCLAIVLFACKDKADGNETVATASTTAVAKPISLPIGYSSSFKMGNPDYVNTIVDGSWKTWQDNKMDNMRSWMADTVILFQSDNTMIKGVDSAMANWKRYRAKYATVIDTIDAVFPVYSTDKNENWVCVWATEYNTKLDGKKDTVSVMETWRINKDGKADMVLQYDRHARKK
jgi:hypothetical protein